MARFLTLSNKPDALATEKKANLPEDAQREEARDATYGSGAPGQTEEAENKPDQKEKPGHSPQGTFKDEGESGPTDIGEAREGAKVCALH